MNKREFFKYLFLLLFAVILISGCNKSVEIKDVSGDSNQIDLQDNPDNELGQMDEEDASGTEDLITAEDEQSDKINTEGTEKKNNNSGQIDKNEVASVIVKSENNLSDSEKQEIVNQLSNEVDDLLNEINSME